MGGLSPLEALTGKSSVYDNLDAWGSEAYVWADPAKRKEGIHATGKLFL